MKKLREIEQTVSKAHIPPAIAIRRMLKQFCRCKFLMLANWWDKKKKKKFLGLTVPEKSLTKILNVWKFERKIKKNKGMNKQQQPDSSIHDTYTHCPYVYQVLTF